MVSYIPVESDSDSTVSIIMIIIIVAVIIIVSIVSVIFPPIFFVLLYFLFRHLPRKDKDSKKDVSIFPEIPVKTVSSSVEAQSPRDIKNIDEESSVTVIDKRHKDSSVHHIYISVNGEAPMCSICGTDIEVGKIYYLCDKCGGDICSGCIAIIDGKDICKNCAKKIGNDRAL